ncbi:MAG: alpha-glucosidase/alpha-galactosidase [Lentisphaerae bacterium]|nr:alpha-glucosidase/alpha-galactosidase [Lentisphaerota bacterium]
MPKITFIGAGSTVFAKSILGDSMLTPSLQESHIALYDIDGTRLKESQLMLETLNANINHGRARITVHLGPARRRDALRGADYVVNAIQVGGYKPSTVIDFEIPKRYGLRQTIADTLGIGGIFRTLRTVPVLQDIAADMARVCPDAWFLNYVNPMCMVTGALLRDGIKTVGLCHSVQVCARELLTSVDMLSRLDRVQTHIAGINHQAWLLSISDGGRDLYPAIKRRAAKNVAEVQRRGVKAIEAEAKATGDENWGRHPLVRTSRDMVRLEMMRRFGYYITESSEHSAEYMPYWIKRTHPELIKRFNIPLDEYPRRCINQIARWKQQRQEIVGNRQLTHERSREYGSHIMDAIETDVPTRIHGNILNTGLITNLPSKAIVEVPCLVDRNGVQGCFVGDLPEQCAALNRTNINVQLMTLEAAYSRRREAVYQAAFLDPHTSAELSLDDMVSLCDDLIRAHGRYLPTYR